MDHKKDSPVETLQCPSLADPRSLNFRQPALQASQPVALQTDEALQVFLIQKPSETLVGENKKFHMLLLKLHYT